MATITDINNKMLTNANNTNVSSEDVHTGAHNQAQSDVAKGVCDFLQTADLSAIAKKSADAVCDITAVLNGYESLLASLAKEQQLLIDVVAQLESLDVRDASAHVYTRAGVVLGRLPEYLLGLRKRMQGHQILLRAANATLDILCKRTTGRIANRIVIKGGQNAAD